MSKNEIIDRVIELFPSADRQALDLLAELLCKDAKSALKPFADHSKSNSNFIGTEDSFAVHVTGWKASERSVLTAADFRRAAKVMETMP